MLFKERQYWVTLSLVLAAVGCLAARPVLAGEKLTIGGSGSTLGAIKILGAAFEKLNPDLTVVVLPSVGTTGGIKGVSGGVIDIGLAGRRLTDEEQTFGLDVTEYATTPVVLAVQADSSLSGLSKNELIGILGGESIIGPHGQRLRPILRSAREPENIVARRVFPELGAAIERGLSRTDATVALTAQEAADLIERVPGAIGLSTFSLIRSEKRHMKALSIDGVAPNATNVANGAYPLVIGQYLVTRPNPPERIRKFIQFVRSEPGKRLLEESGNYVRGQKR